MEQTPVNGTLASELRAGAIDWRARRIADPVERLRYLRRATAGPATSVPATRWFRRSGVPVSLFAIAVFLTIPFFSGSTSSAVSPKPAAMAPHAPSESAEVWAVEQSPAFDLYSNGLRVENEFAVSNEPRPGFPIYAHHPKGPAGSDAPVEWRSEPLGVVFHSTESDQAPFAPAEVRSLKRIGRELLQFVRIHRSYHFVIDRFGRVYRVVRESDRANHAGNSIWSDTRGSVLNLNASFLGVAFEARMDVSNPLNDAQIHSARLLTEMLRSAYRLDPSNFVAHAQVSVNPSNMRIGYHTDWAAGLPFAELGLPDNYTRNVASVALFGFEYDKTFVNAMGGRVWPGLASANDALDRAAAAAGAPLPQYRKQLQQRYKRLMNAQARVSDGSRDEKQQQQN